MPKVPPKPAPAHNRLVNRAPGLLTKGKTTEQSKVVRSGEIDRIAESLTPLRVPIDSLILDENNARLHPERNMEAIKDSLSLYGQTKPIVARKANRVIMAGNGTLEAAKGLGWTEIAVSFVDLTEVEAIGYGLADNRTSELAKWNFEVVSRLDKLMQEAGQAQVGWTLDELEVLRNADWTPPASSSNGDDDEGYTPEGDGSLTLKFTDDAKDIIEAAISERRNRALANDEKEEHNDVQCIALICKEWMANA